MKKILAVSFCLLTLLSCITGCGKTEATDEQPAEESTRPYAGQELNVWTDYVEGTPSWEAANVYIEKFEELTGATVNATHFGADLGTVLYTALESGKDIDVYTTSHVTMGSRKEFAMDLTERMQTSDVMERIYPVLLDVMQMYTEDETLRGIPTTSSFQAFWYNKAAFEMAGIEKKPETMEEFEAACDALVGAGIAPMALDTSYSLINFGAHVERMVGQETVADLVMNGGFSENEDFVAACQKIIDWRARGYFEPNAPGQWPASQNKIGLTEDVAMVYCGTWVSGEIEEMTGADLEWGCFKYPYDPNGKGTYGATVSCSVNCINPNTETPDLAWEYLYFMHTGEANKAITDADGYLVDDMTMEPLPEFSDSKHIMETTTELFTYDGGLHANADIKTSINDLVTELYAGNFETGEEAAEAFDALVG